jgi:hypothetical protein
MEDNAFAQDFDLNGRQGRAFESGLGGCEADKKGRV